MANANNHDDEPDFLPVDPNLGNVSFSSWDHVSDDLGQQSITSQPAAGETLDPGEYMYSTNADGTFTCQFVDPQGITCQNTDTFRRPCDLKKHYKNHTKPKPCDYCKQSFAEPKELHRHMWAKHEDDARALGTPGGNRIPCGFPGCEYKSRRNDNVRRHRETVHPDWHPDRS